MRLLILLFLSGFVACRNDASSFITAEQAIQPDSIPGQCPYLTKDNKGNAVLSWVRMTSDSTAQFCFAVSTDRKTFSQPVAIPGSETIKPHGENLPKIIYKPSGEIIALWGAASASKKNKYSGSVYYCQSFDGGKTWNAARPLVKDTAGYDQRYYDVALLPNGEAGIIWLDNRKTTGKEGSALFFATTQDTSGFVNERRISEPCCQCCRTDLFIDSKHNIHILFRAILQDSIRDMVHAVSTDGGNTFSAPKKISNDNWVLRACPHTGPSMTENKEGIHFAWYTGGANQGSWFTSSTDNGNTFQVPDSVSSLGSHPQLATSPAGDIFIVWDEFGGNGSSNKRIGIQQRNARGKAIAHRFLTGVDVNASYPVLLPLSSISTLVAYTIKKGDRSFINYQYLKIND